MSGLRLILTAPAGDASAAALLLEAGAGSAGSLWYPVAREAGSALGTEEEFLPELSLTVHRGPPLTAALAAELEAGASRVQASCAVLVPWPVEGRLRRQPYYRLGRPGQLVPILTLEATQRALQFDFGAGGAPIARAPARDHGGPIDQIFAEATAAARRELAEWLIRVAALGAGVRLVAQGLDPSATVGLAEALSPVPGLQLEL